MTAVPSTPTDINSITKKISDLIAIQKELQSDLHHVAEDLRVLTESRRKLLARQFIIENGVRLHDVWQSNPQPKDAPYFYTVFQFSHWINKQKNQRRYLEWNGGISIASDSAEVRLPDSGRPYLSDIVEHESQRTEKASKK